MKNNNLENLCRVCSQQATSSLFDQIPIYLHENPREAENWKMPINFLLSKTTNLPVNKNDGLPQKICVLCISYLKHAYSFRKQAIANVLIFKTNQLANKDTTKYNGSLSIFNENTNSTRKKVSTNKQPCEISKKQIQYNKKFEIIDTNASPIEFDGTEESGQQQVRAKSKPKVHEYFNYAEKSFEEDDITLLEVFQDNKNSSIQFNIPENHRERKCVSCRRRFMIDATFNDHINECIQLKLVIFIQDLHNLLVLKESHRISPHDFIRRTIFAVKKCSTFLQKSDYLITNRMAKSSDESNDEDEAIEAVDSKVKRRTVKPSLDNELTFFNYYDVEDDDEPKRIAQSSTKKTAKQTTQKVAFYATKCDLCELMFDSVANLEIHNFKFHNKLPPKPSANYPLPAEAVSVADLAKKQQLLDLFENDNFSVDNSSKSKANKLNNNVRDGGSNSQQPIDLIKNNLKLVKCLQCDDQFYTISHLDEHVVRKHPLGQHSNSSKEKQQNNFDVGRRRNGNKSKPTANESINSFNYYNN